jgi:hypothetical protein
MRTLCSITGTLLCLGLVVSLASGQTGPPQVNGPTNNPGVANTLNPVVVVDDTGQVVGRMIGLQNNGTVLLNEDTPIKAFVDQAGFQKINLQFWYTSSDCTGVRFLIQGPSLVQLMLYIAS